MAKSREPDKGKKRERARDRGAIVPLGVEVSPAHYQAVKELRALLRWSKRTTIEAAIEALAAQHGLKVATPEPSPEE